MKYLLFLLLAAPALVMSQSEATELVGAWKSTFVDANGRENDLVMIVEDGYFVMTAFNVPDSTFIATLGGSYTADGTDFSVVYEFDSSDSTNVGVATAMGYRLTGSVLVFNDDKAWQRIDDGTGVLAGAWQIAGRKEDGEMRRRPATGPRRTMKILSGDRFQWIAYNTETREFLGTGGGTYTTTDQLYQERIEFFSRDASRVGTQLSFDFKIRNDEWHHMGQTSAGAPLYETWGHRPTTK